MRRLVGAACAALTFFVVVPATADTGPSLQPSEQFTAGAPAPQGSVHVPPLDSSVIWARQEGEAVLTLVNENHAQHSWPTGLFVFQRLSDHPAAEGDGTGVSVFQYHNGSSPSVWSTVYHGEVHFGDDYHADGWNTQPNPRANGTAIIYNAELSRWSPLGQVLGVELDAAQQWTAGGAPLKAYPPDAAVNVDGGWINGIRFRGTGQCAICLQAHWNTGVDLAGNTLVNVGSETAQAITASQLNAGRVYLAPGVFIDFSHGRVRVHRAGRVVARF